MPLLTLVDATALTVWAGRRDAQELLPQVLRRLVHATVPTATRVAFAAGEGVLLGGWDGVVVCETGNAYVPAGTSGWEAGTDKNVKGKADRDYNKRTDDPPTPGATGSLGLDRSTASFVFVTPRRWKGKDDWRTARQADGVWREVRAYDAEDLETWLELAPAVHIWLSRIVGRHPEGAGALGVWWADWTESSNPPLSADLVLAGRENAAEGVGAWLSGTEPSLTLSAESRDEALAVLGATVARLPEEERERCLARAIVVSDSDAWGQLVEFDGPLILIPTFDLGALSARALRAGHRVVVPLGAADSPPDNAVVIPRVSRSAAEAALMAMGLPEQRARILAGDARRSLISLRRLLAVNRALQQPPWARPEHARLVLPALVAGAWCDGLEADQSVIAALAGTPYEEVVAALSRWAQEADPPVRRVGDVWYVVAKADAWSLLARFFTRSDLERMRQVAVEVLSAIDPRYDLPTGQRYMAGVFGKVPQHSEHLRAGLADTLAMVGTLGEAPAPNGDSPASYARRAAHDILSLAREDWRRFATVADDLPRLAEAAPDEVLDALNAALVGDEPLVLRLFTDDPTQDPLGMSSSPHVALLWALETLAWSPLYLGRVALLLAVLARRAPAGRLANRPFPSLQRIFLGVNPQTTASLERRLEVIDLLREREPEVAWLLMRRLLPQRPGGLVSTSRPRWRDWAPEHRPELRTGVLVPPSDYVTGVREIVVRLLEDVALNASRWADLIGALGELPSEERAEIVGCLAAIPPTNFAEPDRRRVWDAVRDLMGKHREFPDANWALPADVVEELAGLADRLAPQDPAERFAWLFGTAPRFPGTLDDERTAATGGIGPQGPDQGPQDAARLASRFQRRRERLSAARVEAVRAVFAAGGLAALETMVGQVDQPAEFGSAAGRARLLGPQDVDAVLAAGLGSAEPAADAFAQGLAVACAVTNSASEVRDGSVGGFPDDARVAWVNARLEGPAKGWRPAAEAFLLTLLPPGPATWERVDATRTETQAYYWSMLAPYHIEPADAAEGARRLISHGRGPAALELLAARISDERARVSPELLVECLEAIARAPDLGPVDHSMFAYNVGQALDYLANAAEAGEIDEARIVGLELLYLPVVDMYHRRPRVLHRALVRHPSLFVDTVLAMQPRIGAGEPSPTDAVDTGAHEASASGVSASAEQDDSLDAATDQDDDSVSAASVMEQRNRRAQLAYEVLSSWHEVPGAAGGSEANSLDDGATGPQPDVAPRPLVAAVDGAVLGAWVREARDGLAAAGCGRVGDHWIGQVLGRAPHDDVDGAWPARGVRDVIEAAASDALDAGVWQARYNSRGEFEKGVLEGGRQERALAAGCDADAQTVGDRWPRTAAILRTLANVYRDDAVRADRAAEIRHDLQD
jgi:hypothetical protein